MYHVLSPITGTSRCVGPKRCRSMRLRVDIVSLPPPVAPGQAPLGGRSPHELERALIGFPVGNELCLLGVVDAPQQGMLQLELDLADGERADADARREAQRHAVGLGVAAF